MTKGNMMKFRNKKNKMKREMFEKYLFRNM